jgi:hypothetical protein
MKFSKEALNAANAHIDSHSEIDIADVAKILRDNTPFYDEDLAFKEVCGRKAQALIARKKDKVGVRSIFSDGKRGHFINLELTHDLEKILAIKEQAERQIQALGRVSYKAGMRVAFVSDQISMQEWLASIGENEDLATEFN